MTHLLTHGVQDFGCRYTVGLQSCTMRLYGERGVSRMDEYISRQAVLNKINERQRKLIYCFGFENDAVKIMDIAKSIVIAMPSAQPEIIRCKDCIHNNDCNIQYSAQAGDNFFCGFGETEKDVKEDVYE